MRPAILLVFNTFQHKLCQNAYLFGIKAAHFTQATSHWLHKISVIWQPHEERLQVVRVVLPA